MSSHAIGLTILLIAAGFGVAVAGAAPPAGTALAGACTACHGPQGRSQGRVPALAGMDTQTFLRRMQAFRNGEGTIMNRIAPAYDAEQSAVLAAYFAAQESAAAANRHAP